MQEGKLLCRQIFVISRIQKLSGKTNDAKNGLGNKKKKIKKNEFIKDLKHLVELSNSVCQVQLLPVILFAHLIPGCF